MPAVKTQKRGVNTPRGAPIQVKPSMRITISLPEELIECCDSMATFRHLERNDIIRQAIALGLLGLQAENMRLVGRGAEVDAWFAARGAGADEMAKYNEQVGGSSGFVDSVRAAREADAEEASKHS